MRNSNKDVTRALFCLGSGRCGTMSLASLINAQPATVCFHELNPSAMAWRGADMTVLSLMRDFQDILRGGLRAVTGDRLSPGRLEPARRMQDLARIDAIGDVGFYYLPYVPLVLRHFPDTVFCCLKRDKNDTIRSFVHKLSGENPVDRARNHFASPRDARWRTDRKWDRCFPNFTGLEEHSLEDHIARYYDYYYLKAARYARRYPENFRVFATDDLNSSDGRKRMLDFCLGEKPHVDMQSHLNRTADPPEI